MQPNMDERVVARQLGRTPRAFADVCRRCRYDFPQVILTEPVHPRNGEWEVFPTMHWLTCPLLNQAISRLEVAGLIGHFEERLQADEHFSVTMEEEHRAAAAARLALVPEDVAEWLQRKRPRQWRALEATGVAGIRSAAGVKCLHAHYADYVGRGTNPIGREVEERLRKDTVRIDGNDDCWRYCQVDASEPVDGKEPRP